MSETGVLAAIRRSLGVPADEAPRRRAVAERLAAAPPGVIPRRGQVEGTERIALFVRMAQGAAAEVSLLASTDEVPATIATILRERNLPATLRRGTDPLLAGLPWGETTLTVSEGPSGGGDLHAVSRAVAGVAESGTLVLVSGTDNPTTLNFLPDTHFIVVAAGDIAADYETVWARLRSHYGKGELPRTVNWITGPSRSGDIEQTILLGAHGPRQLHILVTGAA